MMQSNYRQVFGLRVLHSYFENAVCRCLQFNAAADTASLMKKYDCRMRRTINGFDLYINTPSSNADFFNYVQQVTGQTFFEFDISSIDPHFVFFTALPVNWRGGILYDSGDAENKNADNGVQLHAQFSGNATAAVGSLRVRFDDVVKEVMQFQISFDARSTQWQYFVINKNGVVFDAPAIARSAFEFSAQQVVIDNGEQATLFSSGDNLIPLSEVPKYKFDLVNHSQNSRAPRILFKGLPNPDVKRTGIVRVNGQQEYSSPMYIYL